MNYYYTDLYQSYKGLTRNIIYIMDEEERLWLADAINQLISDRDTLIERGALEYHYTKQGTLSKRSKQHPNYMKQYWNARDEESITFLKRLCFFGEFEESQMLDPTDYQLEDLVDKMLVKVYGRFYGKFANWLEFEMGKQLEKNELRSHMDYKRGLYHKMVKLGMVPESLKLPY